jgi:hypothetical protein
LFDKHAPFKKCYFNKFGQGAFLMITDDIRVLQAKRDCAYSEWKSEVNRFRKAKLKKNSDKFS